jgi:hypothetical protein
LPEREQREAEEDRRPDADPPAGPARDQRADERADPADRRDQADRRRLQAELLGREHQVDRAERAPQEVGARPGDDDRAEDRRLADRARPATISSRIGVRSSRAVGGASGRRIVPRMTAETTNEIASTAIAIGAVRTWTSTPPRLKALTSATEPLADRAELAETSWSRSMTVGR